MFSLYTLAKRWTVALDVQLTQCKVPVQLTRRNLALHGTVVHVQGSIVRHGHDLRSRIVVTSAPNLPGKNKNFWCLEMRLKQVSYTDIPVLSKHVLTIEGNHFAIHLHKRMSRLIPDL